MRRFAITHIEAHFEIISVSRGNDVVAQLSRRAPAGSDHVVNSQVLISPVNHPVSQVDHLSAPYNTQTAISPLCSLPSPPRKQSMQSSRSNPRAISLHELAKI